VTIATLPGRFIATYPPNGLLMPGRKSIPDSRGQNQRGSTASAFQPSGGAVAGKGLSRGAPARDSKIAAPALVLVVDFKTNSSWRSYRRSV
jgi:hypothetical protein